MYIVRFVRKDDRHDEEYFYQKLEDAQIHFHLFDEDDSELYQKIYLFEEKHGRLILLDEHPPPQPCSKQRNNPVFTGILL